MKSLKTHVAAIVMAAAVVGCGKAQSGSVGPQAAAARPPAMVTAVAASTANVPIYLEEIGRIVPVESVSILPQVGGKVLAVHFKDGQDVKKGDLLFEIDPRPFEAELQSALATEAQMRAEEEQSRADLNRAQAAISTAAVSQQEFEQKRMMVDVSSAKRQGATAAVETARLNLDYTRVRSPIDGRAGARLVDPGNVVKENDQPMLVIQRLDPIYAEFTINENDLGTVRKYVANRGAEWNSIEQGLTVMVDIPGDSARVLTALGGDGSAAAPTTAPATTGPATRPGAGAREGKLTFLDNTVQKGTGTVKLRATVPNADRYFWPGQFVNVRLVLTTKTDAVLIPTRAQQIGQQGPYVYVVTPEGTAELRPITPGQRQGDQIVVVSGLRAGEKVVVTGQMQVAPGGKVMVTNDIPSGGAQAAR